MTTLLVLGVRMTVLSAVRDGENVGVLLSGSTSTVVAGGGNMDASCTLNEGVAVSTSIRVGEDENEGRGGGGVMEGEDGDRGREGEGQALEDGGAEGLRLEGELDTVFLGEGRGGSPEGIGDLDLVGVWENDGLGDMLDNSKNSSNGPGGALGAADPATATKYRVFGRIGVEMKALNPQKLSLAFTHNKAEQF